MSSKINVIKTLEINKLSKSSYDSWILVPKLDDLSRLFNFKPKCYGNTSSDHTVELVLSGLIKNEPLVEKLSPQVKKKLEQAIIYKFHSINSLLLERGEDGMLVPTFIEIISRFISDIKFLDNDKILVSSFDKQFYSKYYWTFETESQLIYAYYKKPPNLTIT